MTLEDLMCKVQGNSLCDFFIFILKFIVLNDLLCSNLLMM